MRAETDRLILRPWEDRDRDPLAAIMGDAHVRRFYPSTATPAETSTLIDRCRERAEENGFHFQAVENKADGALVGLLGLGRIPAATCDAIPSHPEVEIGWLFDKAFWGRGYAPEGARTWLDFAWRELNLPEVVAFTYEGNLPSRRVMEKIGMSHDPADNFANPNVPQGHPLRPHVLYRITNPALL